VPASASSYRGATSTDRAEWWYPRSDIFAPAGVDVAEDGLQVDRCRPWRTRPPTTRSPACSAQTGRPRRGAGFRPGGLRAEPSRRVAAVWTPSSARTSAAFLVGPARTPAAAVPPTSSGPARPWPRAQHESSCRCRPARSGIRDGRPEGHSRAQRRPGPRPVDPEARRAGENDRLSRWSRGGTFAGRRRRGCARCANAPAWRTTQRPELGTRTGRSPAGTRRFFRPGPGGPRPSATASFQAIDREPVQQAGQLGAAGDPQRSGGHWRSPGSNPGGPAAFFSCTLRLARFLGPRR